MRTDSPHAASNQTCHVKEHVLRVAISKNLKYKACSSELESVGDLSPTGWWWTSQGFVPLCVSYQQVRVISSPAFRRRGNNSVPSRPDTLPALFILQLDLRSDAIRLQTEASFLSCSSDKRELLYRCGESGPLITFRTAKQSEFGSVIVVRAELNCMKLFNGPLMIHPFAWLM